MSLLNRKRVILAKIEVSYGTDPTPTGLANAILVRNINIIPQENEQAQRDLVRTYLGNSEAIPAAIHAKVAATGLTGVLARAVEPAEVAA